MALKNKQQCVASVHFRVFSCKYACPNPCSVCIHATCPYLLCLTVNTSSCHVSFFWHFDRLTTTGVLFLGLTLGAPCFSPTLSLTLLSISCHHPYPMAPFPYPSCQKKSHSFICLRDRMCKKRSECALWSDLDDTATFKNKETHKGVQSLAFIYRCLLHMVAYTHAHIHTWTSSLLCMWTSN